MSFRGRDISDGGSTKMDLGEPRRFPGGNMDDKPLGDERDDRGFDAGRGRRPPFGRGRGMSPPGRMDRPREFGGGYGRDDPPSMRDRSPIRGRDDRFSDRFKKDDGPFPKRDDLGRKSFYGDDPPRDRFMEGRSRFDGPGNFNSRFDGPGDSYKSRPVGGGYSSGASAPPPRSFASEGFPKPNECEIIAVSKNLRNYAESVESRIKNIGVLVDVLFLKDEALLTQTIDDIARRGSLYAMVISPQNETHGSVTVNILHGTPQEHRNMPLEDALKLVTRNFHEHIRTQKEKMERERAERGQYSGGVAADREIQFLLRMLADGRWVSVNEISDVIRYLSERRDKMKQAPGGDRMLGRAAIPSSDVKLDVPFKPKDDIDVSKKEQDLQNRIMNIMNQGAPSSASNTQGLASSLPNVNLPPPRSRMSPGLNNMHSSSGIPGLKPSEEVEKSTAVTNKPSECSTASSTFINFDNASVQKALDNLMQSGPNLLKNITMSSPTKPTNTIPGLGSSSNDSMLGNMGPRADLSGPRGGLSDLGSQRSGPGSELGSQRGPGNMSDLGGSGDLGGQRGSDMMGPQRGGYGSMGDMRGMNSGRGFNSGTGMTSDSGPRIPDLGRMGGPPSGMGSGGGYSGPNQYGKFQSGGPGQQGNFGGSYNNNSNMGNMPRPGYGGAQGMGGQRRY